jgi:uncharacterized membrane protein HdeD (DUF308 family)
MDQLLSKSWWVLALRGAAALLFGILALIWPGITLLVLVSLFAAFALIAGAVSIAGALRNRTMDRGWWLMLVLGIVSVIIGIVAVYRPGATLFVLVLLMAAQALATGVLDIAVAIRLRKVIDHEWLLILTGVLSILFGVLVVLFPPAGAFALAFIAAFYALATGLLLLVLAMRARKWQKGSAPRSGYRDNPTHPRGI